MSIADTIRSFTTPTPEPAGFSAGEICRVLTNQRRRAVVDILDRHGPMRFRDLAEVVASMEEGVPPGKLDTGPRKAVYVALYQTHIGKLEELGIVEMVDGRSGVVHQGPNFEDAVRALEPIRGVCGPKKVVLSYSDDDDKIQSGQTIAPVETNVESDPNTRNFLHSARRIIRQILTKNQETNGQDGGEI